MNTVKIKTSELSGKALDWAVGIAAGFKMSRNRITGLPTAEQNYQLWLDWSPSESWAQLGPLVDHYKIDLYWHSAYEVDGEIMPMCEASLSGDYVVDASAYDPIGETAHIAACRAIVAAELGDEVEIPEELVG